jgi:hypothetical protein
MKKIRATPAARSEFKYISRRLSICEQHPERHTQEIHMLEKARYEILAEWPHICSEFTQEELVGTYNEV